MLDFVRIRKAEQTGKMDEASRILFNQLFSHCELTENRSSIDPRFALSIHPIWNGVDRPNGGGWGLPVSDRLLAERLRRAIISGDAFAYVEIHTDVNGQTYVCAPYMIWSGAMDEDLKKLGY
jgi:hypothetical protein